MILGQNPGYAEFHRNLKEKRTTAANYAWLYAMSCIKKGDSPEATAALETFSTASLTNRDKLFINEELADFLLPTRLEALAFTKAFFLLLLIKTAYDCKSPALIFG